METPGEGKLTQSSGVGYYSLWNVKIFDKAQ